MILRAAQQVTEDPDFDEMLDQTRDRVDEIEGERVVSRWIEWGSEGDGGGCSAGPWLDCWRPGGPCLG
jgi:hypothetical protein